MSHPNDTSSSTGASDGAKRAMERNDILRLGFLPSDFHPMVLLLGEKDVLQKVAGALARFAADRKDIALHAWAFCAVDDDITVTLTTSGAAPGLRAADLQQKDFIWTVEPWQAEYFSELVSELTEPGHKSGSAVLGCGSIGEIPVKVSLGEFTDDFLGRTNTSVGA